MTNYERIRDATGTILSFMGSLNQHYDSTVMEKLRQAESDMEARYGLITLADLIRKDRNAAEVALIRYAMRHPVQEEPSLYTPYRPRQKKSRPNIGRYILIGAVAAIVIFVFSTMIAGTAAIERSERILAVTEEAE